eukprot:TRINITY_DN11510_c0_g1_i3.p1 TRINITY_DN11510_c0_g1~~TRINITY_DN11510_c0_g1_i3.p1  ORF type:complete len:451 (+),score=78.31 TRINITY_DN11510_c0_g1_i3:71-1423(+)
MAQRWFGLIKLLFSSAWAIEDLLSAFESELAADDACLDCSSDNPEECSLDLLQLRGEATAADIEDQPDKHPAWKTVILHQAAREKGAVCLDGSPAGYYFAPGHGSGKHKWMIHLQGGGWCVDEEECTQRASSPLGSSKTYHTTNEKNKILGYYDGGAQGLLSLSCRNNPDFCDWNKVYVRYCDGASYAGEVDHPVTTKSGRKLYFRGRRVLDAVLDDLLHQQGMAHGTDLLAKGCSAGGLGIWLNLDHIADRMPSSLAVKGLPECGYFMELPSYTGSRKWPDNFKNVAKMQNVIGQMNKECLQAHASDSWHCMYPQNAASYVKTPHFVINSVYDAFQMQYFLDLPTDCVKHNRCSPQQRKAADTLRSEMIASIKKTSEKSGAGYFLYNCVTHCWQMNRNDRWKTLADHTGHDHFSGSLRQAFTAWYKTGKLVRSTGAAKLGPNSERSCHR